MSISEDSELIRLYEEKIKRVVQRMPRGLSFEEKVEYLYTYLVNELEYDYACLERNAGGGRVESSSFEDDDENVPEAYRNKGLQELL